MLRAAGDEKGLEVYPRLGRELPSCLGWDDFFQCPLATDVLLTSSVDQGLSSDQKRGGN